MSETPGSVSDLWGGAHEAVCAYLDAVDSADLDRLGRLLEHATVVLPSGRITGGPAVQQAYGPLLEPSRPDGRRRTKHHLTNLVVSGPDGDGVLTAEASYLVLGVGEDGPRLVKSGRPRPAGAGAERRLADPRASRPARPLSRPRSQDADGAGTAEVPAPHTRLSGQNPPSSRIMPPICSCSCGLPARPRRSSAPSRTRPS